MNTVQLAAIQSFVSLGNNCEFGFVQRKLGLEPSSLLRWAIAKSIDVDAFLKFDPSGSELAQIYRLEGLSPHTEGMVRDKLTNFCFHTQIEIRKSDKSGKLGFYGDTSLRHATWEKEKSKIDYLASRFFSYLKEQPSTYVIKDDGSSFSNCEAIYEYLKQLNSQNRLLVIRAEPDRVGMTESIDVGFQIGHISRFSPYSLASDCEYGDWNNLLAEYIDKHS